MNDIGTILYGGLSAQVAILILSYARWRGARRKSSAPLVGLVAGSLVFVLIISPLAFQLFGRIGLAYFPTCAADQLCRKELLFLASWLSLYLIVFLLQAALFAVCRSSIRKQSSGAQ